MGITGGIASGKSVVAGTLRGMGFHVIDADALGHTLMEPGTRAYGEILTEFGADIAGADGRIDRVKLGAMVFAIALGLIGVVTKALGGILGAREMGRWGSVGVGFGMVPRGEVGIVVANLALATGVVDASLFAVMLVAVVITTVVAPYLLTWVIPRVEAEEAAAQAA